MFATSKQGSASNKRVPTFLRATRNKQEGENILSTELRRIKVVQIKQQGEWGA